jgi:hypothetical protein
MGDRSVTAGECPSCAGTSSFPFCAGCSAFQNFVPFDQRRRLKKAAMPFIEKQEEGEPVPLVLRRISFCLRKRIQKHREFNHAAPTFRVFAG